MECSCFRLTKEKDNALSFKKNDGNPSYNMVINRAGLGLIDGVTSKTLDAQRESLTIQSDGSSNRYILATLP
jgi:hypothetical protein